MKTMTKKQKKLALNKYVGKYGNFCPFCDSGNIAAGHGEFEDLSAWREVQCRDCREVWTEEFALTGITELY